MIVPTMRLAWYRFAARTVVPLWYDTRSWNDSEVWENL